MKRISVRQSKKTDRRAGPIGSDRRSDRRRRGDKVDKHLHEIDEEKKRLKFENELRGWPTSKLIKRFATNAFLDRHWENELIAAELDARIPPRA